MADDTPIDVTDESIIADLSDEPQESSEKDSSPEETKTPEVAKEDGAEKPAGQPESEPKAEDTPEDKSNDVVEEPTEEDKPLAKAEERKQQLNTEIRDLVSQRNALRTEVEKANAEVYQPATEEQLVDEGMSQVEAKVEAMRQEREMEKFNTQVAETQLTLETESSRVIQDFPMFDPKSAEYKEDVANQAAQLLNKNLLRDPNTGQIIGSNISPYELYQTIASAHQASSVENQIKGQKATEKMLASADPSTSVSPTPKKKDELLELWAE